MSNWSFIGLTLLLLFAWVIISTLWKVGAIDKVKVTKNIIPSFEAIYISYEGSYESIGIIYKQSI